MKIMPDLSSAVRRLSYLFTSFMLTLLIVSTASASPGDLHTFAGIGTSGFSGDNGIAAAAGISNPAGVVVDAAGNHGCR